MGLRIGILGWQDSNRTTRFSNPCRVSKIGTHFISLITAAIVRFHSIDDLWRTALALKLTP
jgi:hypothetical protein